MRVLAIAIILLVMMAALWILMVILEDMRPQKDAMDDGPAAAQIR